MRSRKAVFAGVALLAAVVVGLYGSGLLTFMLLGLHDQPVQWNTYGQYIRALDQPQFAPYALRIKIAGIIGFGVPALSWLGLLVLLVKSKKRSLHGEAHFATASDLAKQGMFTPSPTSLIVGKMRGKFVYMSGQQFAILAAPTRSGKGVGIVIPNLLSYPGSIVVLDIKQENFDLTSGWRQSQGQDVFLFNPFAEDMRSARWNPLHYVSDGVYRISDLMALAETLYPDGSSDQKFWVSQARNAFVAFTMYLFEKRDAQRVKDRPSRNIQEPTLGQVFRLSSGDGTELKACLRGLSQQPFLSGDAKNAFSNLLSQADDTFSSIMGSFREPLNMFINPVLDAATSGNDFLLTDVRKKPMTIYIGIQPNKLAESRIIINMFFSQLVKLNTKELPSQNTELKHQCLLLMDEFTAIGKVDVIASAVSFIAGYNLRMLPIIQSTSQLEAVYGRDVARTFVTNHALQIVYTPREQRDANEYSEMLGYTTVRKQNITRGRDVSRSESEERRALMLPQELKAMSGEKEVFFYEGIPHPVMCDKIRYYQDKLFTRRLLPRVEVPALDIRG
ncbi:type IV secretory system conjugative DNA transfer family protein [Dyella subtropica]|uniref:type IV secretory system conjugative DNA transfer family protein n=1 Tax=Dyella subtropica TaxID=2992127 RepID=UPI002257EAF4|nr:type IV secretory system conjugative DNA transfer family protein [Dyella subtropica]